MFNDSEIQIIKFDSCIEEKRFFNEDSCQTANIKSRNIEAQTVTVTCAETQVTFENTSNDLSFSAPKDTKNLYLFLKNVSSYLYNELDNCTGDDYLKLHNKLNWNNKEENEKVEINDSNSLKEIIPKNDYEDALVSHLTWNSNGMLLGIAFSKKVHEGWCNHEMGINLYNFNKNSFERKSCKTIKSTSCIKQIQFHPFIPSILAGGFQNGEVLIWDVKNVDVIAFLKIKQNGEEEYHNEVVTFVGWKEYESNLNLITAGNDGKIFFWKVLLGNLTYSVIKRFLIFRNNETDISTWGEYFENLCIGFWSDKKSDFIVTADEKILHCSLRTKDNGTSSKYENPICFNYTPHKGIVTGVTCLSQSNFFATCAMDGEIRIYVSGNKIPTYLLCPKKLASNIKWIDGGNLLISWGRSGIVEYHKFNFFEKTYFSNTIYNADKNISTVAFNPKRKDNLAFGCENGEVVILKFHY